MYKCTSWKCLGLLGLENCLCLCSVSFSAPNRILFFFFFFFFLLMLLTWTWNVKIRTKEIKERCVMLCCLSTLQGTAFYTLYICVLLSVNHFFHNIWDTYIIYWVHATLFLWVLSAFILVIFFKFVFNLLICLLIFHKGCQW